MVGAADGEDAAPDEAVPDEGAADEDAAEDATAGGALDNPVPAAVAEALEDAAAGDTADPAAPLEAPAPTVVVDVLVTTACEDVDPLHAASSASTPPRPTTASSVRRTKDERSPAAPPIRSGQLVEIRPTKCTRTRHAATREQTRAQARLTTASSCPECRMLSAISWSPDLWSSLHSVRPRPGPPSQNHQQSDAASGSRRVHCPRGTCYEVALKSSGKSRVVLARYARNRRLSDALHQKAFAALTASPGARGFYDAHRERGNTHHQALRVLGNKTHRHPHGCLRHHQPYNETIAWAAQTSAVAA